MPVIASVYKCYTRLLYITFVYGSIINIQLYEMKLIDKIAGNIEKHRKGITYDRLSKMADIPLSTLMNIKRKQINDVRMSTMMAIANALKCTTDDLVK